MKIERTDAFAIGNRSEEYSNPENIRKNIKGNTVKLRLSNGLTKREVAAALGMNENTYRIWEDPAKSCPKCHDIVKLAKMYGVTCDFIMTNSTDIPESQSVKSRKADIFSKNDKEKYLSELSPYEKLLVMKTRQLSLAEKDRLNEFITELTKDN